jgi:hypothetical protein
LHDLEVGLLDTHLNASSRSVAGLPGISGKLIGAFREIGDTSLHRDYISHGEQARRAGADLDSRRGVRMLESGGNGCTSRVRAQQNLGYMGSATHGPDQ